MSSNAVVEKSYDVLVVSRGVEAFLSGMPAAFLYAALEGFKKVGMESGDLGITEELMDAKSLAAIIQFVQPGMRVNDTNDVFIGGFRVNVVL